MEDKILSESQIAMLKKYCNCIPTQQLVNYIKAGYVTLDELSELESKKKDLIIRMIDGDDSLGHKDGDGIFSQSGLSRSHKWKQVLPLGEFLGEILDILAYYNEPLLNEAYNRLDKLFDEICVESGNPDYSIEHLRKTNPDFVQFVDDIINWSERLTAINKAYPCVPERRLTDQEYLNIHLKRIHIAIDFIKLYPNSFFLNSAWYAVRDDRKAILEDMAANPENYEMYMIKYFLDANLFNEMELIEVGIITEKILKLMYDYQGLASSIYQELNTDIQLKDGCTDVLFIGLPNSGKSCILSGIVGANGNGYTCQMNNETGTFVRCLSNLVEKGIPLGRTPKNCAPTIRCSLFKQRKGIEYECSVNFIEIQKDMLKENFLDGHEVALENMNWNPINLFTNLNRKILFFVIDPVENSISLPKGLGDGLFAMRKLSQTNVFCRIVDLLEANENIRILQRIVAIHFIVTKADKLKNKAEFFEAFKADNQTLIAKIRHLCRQNGINYTTSFCPNMFMFSLGKFYINSFYDFNLTDTLNLMDVIRSIIAVKRKKKSWNQIIQCILKRIK